MWQLLYFVIFSSNTKIRSGDISPITKCFQWKRRTVHWHSCIVKIPLCHICCSLCTSIDSNFAFPVSLTEYKIINDQKSLFLWRGLSVINSAISCTRVLFYVFVAYMPRVTLRTISVLLSPSHFINFSFHTI